MTTSWQREVNPKDNIYYIHYSLTSCYCYGLNKFIMRVQLTVNSAAAAAADQPWLRGHGDVRHSGSCSLSWVWTW